MKNYSKQRETILNVLRSTDTHPTASWIYEQSRLKLPKISLGTIYRNLSELVETQEIVRVAVGDGFEHFDANIKPHTHLHCNKCGNIIDADLIKNPFTEIENDYGFVPQNLLCIVNGICKNCKKN